MKFNDFKRKVRNEEIVTPDVLDRIDATYEKTNIRSRRKLYIPSFYKYAIPALSVFLISLVVAVMVSNNTIIDMVHGTKNNSSSITTYDNIEELNEKLSYRNKLYNNDGLLYYDVDGVQLFPKNGLDIVYESSPATSDATSEPGASVPNNEISKTNTQFSNVDEADVIKSDGLNIYRISNGSLLVNSIDNGVIGDTTKKEIITQDNCRLMNAYIYLTDKYVIVLTTLLEYNKTNENDPVFNYRFNSYTSYVLVNVYSKSSLDLVKSFKGEGYFIDSRIVYNDETDLNTLYFIYVEHITMKDNKYSLPSEILDGVTTYKDCKNIYYSNDFINNAYTHFVSIRLDDELKTNSVVQTGPSNYPIVYVNDNSLYLVSRNSKYDMELYIINAVDAVEYSESLIKYDINDGKITPVASLIVSGELLNQFSLDEYNGYLRLALAQTNHNKIEVYELKNNKFNLVGSITEGLGLENETIKSARFNKDTCLVVTAKNTDPLYKIDLSDPYNPTILGQFKEDGFNTYLQYLDGDLSGYAFAIGYNTEDISEYYNVRKGTKFDLYNVKGDNPVELDEVNYDPIYIDAIDNHKSIFVYKNYIGFEVDKTYYLYEIVMGDDDYKLNEVIKYDYNLTPENEDDLWLYQNGYQITDSRMYYVNGYFYLSYKTKDDATCIYYSIYETMIVSFDSNYQIVDTIK